MRWIDAGEIKGWQRVALRCLRAVVFGAGLWGCATMAFSLGANRATTAMLLLLSVLLITTLGDRFLAFCSCGVASMAFSYYFIDRVGSFAISTSAGAVTLGTMALTAFTGSRLTFKARERADEAIRRREEMERLQGLGQVLLAAATVDEAAESAVHKVVELFGAEGAVLRISGVEQVFTAGVTDGSKGRSEIVLGGGNCLELYGPKASEEVRSAIGSMIHLVIERARSAEAKSRIEAEQRGEELRGTVLNALAHDFKTPLTSIKAAASALRQSRSLTAEPDRDLAAAIDEEAERLGRLIQESLELAQLQSRQRNPLNEECRVAAVVARVTRRMGRYLERRRFVVEVPEDLPTVRGDSFLFEQMLIQVVDNAWKYSPPGSQIEIAAEDAGREVILTVRNEASEIGPSEQALIFDKFYRGSKTRASVEGTGLGLAIARSIAEALGGRVWLDMEAAGPAFRFALPIEGRRALPEGATGESIDREPHYSAHR